MSLRLMVSIPSHSGTIVMQCAATLLAAQEIVRSRRGSFWFSQYGGAVITVVRNAIAAHFLDSDADLLLMLDSDQGLERATIERMIDLGQPVVGCLYPMRRYNWGNVHVQGSLADPNLVPNQALNYVGALAADGQGQVAIVDGFAKATHVGTGAMIIRREAFEKLMSHFPELRGCGFGEDAYPELRNNWGFFNPVFREDGLPLSEDISFCRRWLETGGEIWADVVGRTSHVGPHAFTGSYIESWQSHQPVQVP